MASEAVTPRAVPPLLAQLPHALSFSRVLFTGLIYVAAVQHDKPMFAVLVLLAVVTDILDGPLARGLGTANKFGANVDSAADLLFYVSLPAWAYLFDPGFVTSNFWVIFAFTVLYVGAMVLSHRAFGALGVHNRLSRLSGTAGIVFAFYNVLWGDHTLLYFVTFVILCADLAQRYGAVIQHHRARLRHGA